MATQDHTADGDEITPAPRTLTYARFINGKEAFETRIRRIERALPDEGDVQILSMTDRQYRDIVHFSDQGRKAARKNPSQLVLF